MFEKCHEGKRKKVKDSSGRGRAPNQGGRRSFQLDIYISNLISVKEIKGLLRFFLILKFISIPCVRIKHEEQESFSVKA